MAVSAVAGLATAIGAAAAKIKFFGLTGVKAFFGYFALGASLSALSRALAPIPKLGSQMRGLTATTREPAGSRKLIYGEIRVGGQIVFIANSGQTNEYLHLVIVYASHEIESFEEFWFNDNKVYENNAVASDWSDYVTIAKFDGTQTAADSTLTSVSNEWTSNHILNGMAYAHFRLKWDQDKFPQGVPNISAVVKGKKVYDPRDSNQSATDSSTWTYSQNPALCVRDYLVDTKYGLGEDRTLIDSTALTAAANLCEESISLDGGGTQDRYKLNGQIDTGNQIKDNIEQMLSAMGGTMSYSGGKYFIRGAEYVTPTVSFDEADCVADIQVQTKQSRRSGYNGVKGIFVSEEKDYKVLDYPAQISSTYATEDGDPIYLDMPLPFVTNNVQAQRIAKIALLKSRQQTVISMVVNLKGLRVKVGDTINISNTHLGYSNKVFEVIDYSLAIADGGNLAVSLTCIETASAIYDWTTSDQEDFLSGGTLPLYDGRTVDNVTSLTATEIGLRGPDGGVLSAVQLAWTAPDDAFIEYYTVRYNKNGTTDYFEVQTRETNALLEGLDITSNYDFRVKAQNLIGVRSSGTSLNNVALNGDTTAPSAPTGGTATGGIQTITAEWSNPSDIDFKHVEVYVNTTDSIPASPTAVVDGEEYVVTGLSGAVTRYFWLKSVDFSGNKSAATASFNGTSVVASNSDIGTGAVDTDEIADDAVTIDKIANTLESTNYVANTSGWRLTTAGDFEAGNGTFRGAVTATSITLDGTSITEGQLESAVQTSLGLADTATQNDTAFAAKVAWGYDEDVQGWTSNQMTVTHNDEGYVNLAATGNDPMWILNNQSIDGGKDHIVRVRIKRTAGSGWQGTLYYGTSGHSDSESYKKTISDTTVTNEWVVLEYDMSNLTAGGTDWVDNTITRLRFDWGNSSSDTFQVDWIAVGTKGAAPVREGGDVISGTIGGTTITGTQLYQGTGTWANSNTGFYLDNTGKFSLKDKLFFNPTNARLTVAGNITADTITVEDTLEVFGPLQAKSLAAGSITREMLSQDVLDEIFGALATSIGGSNGDYKEGTGNFTTSGGTVTLGTSSDKFDHGTADVDVEFIVDHFFYATTNYTTAQAQATLNFEVSADGTFTDLTSATKTHTLQFNEYDLSSYYGYTYLVYYLTGDVTKTFTSGSGNDIPDDTDLQFRVRVTGVGTAFTSQTVPFTLEANEGVTGVVSTGGNADTLDNLDSTAFLRSNTNDTFDGDLTVTGQLILQGSIDQYNVTDLDVADKTITVNAGGTQSLSNGAGLIVDRGTAVDGYIKWDETNDRFNFSHAIFAGRTVSDQGTVSYTNNAATFSSLGVTHTDSESNVLRLMRDGTSGVVYAGLADFNLSRWESSDVASRTALSLKLGHGNLNSISSTTVPTVVTFKSDKSTEFFGAVTVVSLRTDLGSASSPAIQVGDNDSGFYDSGGNQVGVTLGGVLEYDFQPTQLNLQNNNLVTTGAVVTGTGSAASPAIGVGDNNSGFYDSGANEIGVTLDGVLEYEFTPTQFNMAANNLVTSGTLSSGAITSSASVIASGNSNSFGNTTISNLTVTSVTASGSITASGNSNSFGNTTVGSLASGAITASALIKGTRSATSADVDYLQFHMPSWSGHTSYLKSLVWHDGANNIAAIGAEYDGNKTNIHFHSQYNSAYKGTSVKTFSVYGNGNVNVLGTITSGAITSSGTITTSGSFVGVNAILDNILAKTSSGNILFKTNAGASIARFNNNLSADFFGTISSGAITSSGNIVSNNSNVGRLYLGNTSASYYAGGIIAERSSYAPTGKLSFQVPTHGVGTDYGLTEQMSITVSAPDTKNATIVMLPYGGKVGIGTSPSAPLHVVNASPELRLQDSDDNGYLALNHNGANSYVSTTQGGILFRTGGITERMRIDASGNVGIGVSAPSDSTNNGDNLVIGGESNVGMTFFSSATTGNGAIYFADGNAAAGAAAYRGIIAYAHIDDSMKFHTATNERMRIDSSGRVGINRTPSISNSKLEVSGADNVPLINVEASGNTGGIGIGSTGFQFFHGSTARMRIDSSGNLHLSGQTIVDGGALSAPSYSFAGDTNTGISRPTSDAVNIVTGGSERLRIDGSGNAGLGTSSPAGRLHLRDTAPHLYIQSDDGQSGKLLFGDATDNSRGGIEYMSTDDMRFMNNNLSTVMTLRYTGNVGIGTTLPLAKMHSVTSASTTAALIATQSGHDPSTSWGTPPTAIIGGFLSGNHDGSDQNSGFRMAVISPNTNGGNSPAMVRNQVWITGGISGEAYNSAARWDLGRWQNNGTDARSRLDLYLADDVQQWDHVMTWRAQGSGATRVGIGTNNPSQLLTVNGTATITGSTGIQVISLTRTSDHGLVTVQNSSGTPRVQLHSSGNSYFNGGNLGVGNTAPAVKFHVSGSSLGSTSGDEQEHSIIQGSRHKLIFKEVRTANATDWNSTTYRLQHRVDSTNMCAIDFVSDSGYSRHIDFRVTSNTFAARMDNAGNWLVGKTSSNYTVAGGEMRDHGTIGGTTTTQTPFFANRTTDDGNLFEFYRSTTLVGTISSLSSRMAIGSTDTGIFFDSTRDCLSPFSMTTNEGRNAAIDIGRSGVAFRDLYLSRDVHCETIEADGGNLIIGDEAFSSDGNYVGLKTSGMTGSSDYMIISAPNDGNTYVSAKNGNSVYIRGGGNLASNEIQVPDSTYIQVDTNNLRVEGNVTAYHSSDQSLKENIRVIDSPIERIKRIRGVFFDWKDDYIKTQSGDGEIDVRKDDVGVIAQDVQPVLDEVVTTRKDGTLAVRYEKMVALCIEAIKEQQDTIESLTKRIEELENGDN